LVKTSIEPIEAAIAKLPVMRYEIKTVSHVARTLQEIDFPIDLDFLSFISKLLS
jgi:hypothetical protein